MQFKMLVFKNWFSKIFDFEIFKIVILDYICKSNFKLYYTGAKIISFYSISKDKILHCVY